MAELQHYGVRGMKWKEHKMASDLPGDTILRKPKLVIPGSHKFIKPTPKDLPGDGVVNKPRQILSTPVRSAVKMERAKQLLAKKKKRKYKDVSSKTVTSGRMMVSNMKPLLNQKISDFANIKVSKMEK